MRLFEFSKKREGEGLGDNVYYGRFPLSRCYLCVFEQGTLKYVDYSFAHQCVPIMTEG